MSQAWKLHPLPKPRFNPGTLRKGLPAICRLSPEQRSERASKAGNAVLCRYGVAYYAAIGRLSREKRLREISQA